MGENDPARGVARAPSMADVAERAGVSHQTVSRVLNDHPSVRPETRQRVVDAIAELGYRRNSAARALVTRRSATIGVVTTGSALYGPISTLIAIEEAARAGGYFVSVATITTYDMSTLHRVLDHFMSQGVEGIVVIAPQDDVARAVESFDAPVPVVTVAAGGAGLTGTGSTALVAAVDQRAGAILATRHLIDLGHTRVLHVAGPDDWPDARERVAGWREALAVAGIDDDGLLVRADWTPERGYVEGLRIAEGLGRDDAPTAVFAANDQLALGMLRAFTEAGVDVPGDVSLVGFDDVEGAAFFGPGLTTVSQPFDALGRACLDQLVEAFGGGAPHYVAIEPRLVVRATTASR